MSRSRRKTPITGWTTSKSEKKDKQIANRRFRRREKQAIYHGEEPPEDPNEVSNPWDFAKDGKQYIDEETRKKFPSWLRK